MSDLQNSLIFLKAAAESMPSPDKIGEALSLISRGTPFDQLFFEKLNDPAWLPILVRQGYFSKLPGIQTIEGGRQSYPYHLPLIGLARLAEKAPHAVSSILARIELPENPTVGDQVLRCIASIREPSCIPILHPLLIKLGEGQNRSSWVWIQELLKNWIEAKAFSDVLVVTNSYLLAAIGSFTNKAPTRDGWMVQQVDSISLERLTPEYPLQIATIVANALLGWIEKENPEPVRMREGQSNDIEGLLGEDFSSSYWLEDFRIQPSYREFEGTLARRLFLASEQVYRQGDLAKIELIDQLLRSRSWVLFERIRWQLYADYPKISFERARKDVLLRIPFLNRIELFHNYEFAQLLCSHAKQHGDAFLAPKEVEQFANSVMKGPIDRDRKLLEGDNEFFYRKQLWPIAALLRGKHLATYRVLVPDDGKIKIESFKPFISSGGSGGFVASKSPMKADTLGAMKDQDLWNYLKIWEPKPGYEYDSTGKLQHENIFELAAEFIELVEKLPQRFDPANKWWQNIDRSEILNKFLDKAADRVSTKQNDEKSPTLTPTEGEWATWFGITQWVMSQPWPRHAPSRFLRNILKSECIIPERYFSELPELLRQLITEADTQLSANKNSFGDWLTTAINSVRGEAIEALLNLASRQKNADKKIEPWIFELIRSRLESPEESPAIFALLGTNLRFLIHLFRQELKGSPSLLFPQNRPEHRLAVITAHFKYDQPWNAIIETFPTFLGDALDVLEAMQADAKDDNTKQNRRDFGSRLGTHIACYYWSDSFATSLEGQTILDRFFNVTSKSIRATLISEIGRIWESQKGERPDEKIICKVLHIWERRLAQIETKLKFDEASTEYDGELAESIDWLSCECFPFEWRFKHAKSALKRLKKAPQAYRLIKAITEYSLVPDRLESMLDLFKALLKKPSDELRWSIQFKDLAPVISLGLASDKPSTKKLAGECKDLLLKMGFFDFLNLGNDSGK
jgi:hypothetical protein